MSRPKRPPLIMAHDTPADKAAALAACCASLRDFVLTAARDGSTFHHFEQNLWHLLLELGRAATGQFLDRQGSGDLGPELILPDGQHLLRLDQLHNRPLTCLFGTFTLQRTCYGTREGQKIDFVPLDTRLQLPAGKSSYLLQDFNGLLDTEQPFAQVAVALGRILNLKQYDDALQRQCQHMAEQVEPYRDTQEAPPWQEEGAILVQTADAKGVPMRRSADAPPIQSHAHKRGPKTGRKKQAIVGAVYSVDPLVRTPRDIVDALFRAPDADKPEHEKRPPPCFKRVMARLNEYTDEQGRAHDGMAEVFAWMAEELDGRNPLHDKVIINLMDGDERFPEERKRHVVNGVQVDILDLLHVTPRLWKVAGLFAQQDSKEAEQQVRTWVLKILRGQVQAVLRDMRAKGEEAGLSGTKKKELDKACQYMWKRRKQMRYQEYLKAGYPIASGVIEGACRHYVKDRMERTGMSWKQPGAQAMLELRSVALNGTWDDFQAFYRQRECEALYPHRHLLETIPWPLAQAA
jgi:hypothetical protein